MISLTDFDFHKKYVLVRCDFNVPVENQKVIDDFRIQSALKTIKFLRAEGAKIVLCSHFGDPDRVKNKREKQKNFSLELVKGKIEQLLHQKIKFLKNVADKKFSREVKKLKEGEIILLENLRFYEGEKKCDPKFARLLAEPFDCFVNEAFSVSHRNHASVVLLPKFLLGFLGFQFQKELENLSPVRNNPSRPFVVLVGGAKVDSKIKVIEKFLQRADFVLVGGKIANTILAVKGISIGKTWPQKEIVEIIQRIDLTNPKLRLPVDVLASPDPSGEIYVRETAPGSVRNDEDIYDIGSESVKTFSEIIKNARTFVWAGPVGAFETKSFSQGTREIAKVLSEGFSGFSVVGGGDTIRALKELGRLEDVSFVSTGGGAMLKFLTGESLPALEALGVNNEI